jgi:hypothetical protein
MTASSTNTQGKVVERPCAALEVVEDARAYIDYRLCMYRLLC